MQYSKAFTRWQHEALSQTDASCKACLQCTFKAARPYILLHYIITSSLHHYIIITSLHHHYIIITSLHTTLHSIYGLALTTYTLNATAGRASAYMYTHTTSSKRLPRHGWITKSYIFEQTHQLSHRSIPITEVARDCAIASVPSRNAPYAFLIS